jgi:hypothetical protein
VRTHKTTTRVLIWTSLAATLLLWPADALAQRRGGHGGGGRVSRPVARTYRPVARYYRPYYYRPYYYNPYFYSSFYWGWGGYGWYPYQGYWGYPYGGGYYRPWYDDLGSLRVEVKPREAQVYVDGYFAGLVDDFDGISQRLRAKPGEHQIEIYLPGFQSIKETMLFRPGSSLKLKTVMQPLASGEPQPPKPEPIAPPPSPPEATEPGQPSSDDYPARRTPPPYRQGPDVERGRVERAEPAPAAPSEEGQQARAGFGTLSIRVQPGDAEVLIDGEKWEGVDPRGRLSIELSEGTHRIEVQKAGFTTYSTEVRVRRGQVTTLNVSLTGARQI